MKREDLHYGFWVRAYTTSLLDKGPSFLGQVDGFGRLPTAQGDEDTVWLENSQHGRVEVPMKYVIEHVEFWPPPQAGDRVCVMVTDHPDFPKEFRAYLIGQARAHLYVRPEQREVLDSMVAVWNSSHNPAPEYPWRVEEVVLLPALTQAPMRDPENQPRLF